MTNISLASEVKLVLIVMGTLASDRKPAVSSCSRVSWQYLEINIEYCILFKCYIYRSHCAVCSRKLLLSRILPNIIIDNNLTPLALSRPLSFSSTQCRQVAYSDILMASKLSLSNHTSISLPAGATSLHAHWSPVAYR